MANMVSKDSIIDFFKNCKETVGNLMVIFLDKCFSQVKEKGFSEGIEIGIRNTLATLYEANVEDKEIIRVVCEYWEITKQDAENRLIYEKQQAAIHSLKQYLKLQGWTQNEINSFMHEHNAYIKISHNKGLWKLKDAPAKLFKAVQVHK